MTGIRERLLGLCLPPLLFATLDGGLTLAGQSATYWSGVRSEVNELSPTFHELLAIHPLAFAGGLLLWIGVFCAAILLLPDTPALVVSIAVTLGHTVGAATWLLFRFQYGYQVCMGLFLLAATAVGLGIRRGWRAEPREAYSIPLSLRWRWVIAAALFLVGVYLFLWPRSV